MDGVAPLKLDAFPVLVFLSVSFCLCFSTLCLPLGATFKCRRGEKWEYSEMQNLFSDYSDAKAPSQKLAPRVFQPEKDDICKEPSVILQLPNCGSVGQFGLAFKSLHAAE